MKVLGFTFVLVVSFSVFILNSVSYAGSGQSISEEEWNDPSRTVSSKGGQGQVESDEEPDIGPILYKGRAHLDQRGALVKFTIKGNKAVGTMEVESICDVNVRLAGAVLNFEGTVTGPWEGKDSYIEGVWSGYDISCSGEEIPNRGEFKFFVKTDDVPHPMLHFRVTGLRGRYGYDFDLHNKVYTSNKTKGALVFIAPDLPFKSELGPPGRDYSTGAPDPSLWEKDLRERVGYGSSATVRTGEFYSELRRVFTFETVVVQPGQTTFVPFRSKTEKRAWNPSTKKLSTNSDPCKELASFVEVLPSGIARVNNLKNGLEVEGLFPGEGEIWCWSQLECTDASGNKYTAMGVGIYILLVGDKAVERYVQAKGGKPLPPPPVGDIREARIKGIAKKVDTGQPVSGARVSLVYPQGGVITKDSWLTRSDGSFDITAYNLMSGTYEILVQLTGQPPDENCPREIWEKGAPKGGVACDLWPVEKVSVELSRDEPQANAGIIWLDYAYKIFSIE